MILFLSTLNTSIELLLIITETRSFIYILQRPYWKHTRQPLTRSDDNYGQKQGIIFLFG